MLYIEHMEMTNFPNGSVGRFSSTLADSSYCYKENKTKKHDQSYTPTLLPVPTEQNKLHLQANDDYFPSLVFEIAI